MFGVQRGMLKDDDRSELYFFVFGSGVRAVEIASFLRFSKESPCLLLADRGLFLWGLV